MRASWRSSSNLRFAAIVLLLTGCGGGGDAVTPPPPTTARVASVVVAPSGAVTLAVGATYQYAATVIGVDGALVDQAVTWSNSGGSPGFVVSATGLVTAVAPTTAPQGYCVRATSVADPSKFGCGGVIVVAGSYSLRVATSDGVVGAPAGGSSDQPAGTRVSYSFAPATTHENLRVLVDGIAAPAAGTVTMSANRTISVVADRKVLVPPAVQSQVDATAGAMRQIVGARPMDAYRATNAAINAMASRVTIDSLVRYIRVARLKGLEGLDIVAVARGIKQINDSLAVQGTSKSVMLRKRPTAGLPRISSGVFNTNAPLSGNGGVLYLYVNGIGTVDTDASTTTQTFLSAVLANVSSIGQLPFYVDNYYNPTGNTSDVEEIAAQTCIQIGKDKTLEGQTIQWNDVDNCETIIRLVFARKGIIGDLSESLVQLLVRWNTTVPSGVTARGLADRIAGELGSHRVVLVAHSQGNLFVDAAYRQLEQMTGVNASCIGTVSLAPPAPIRPLQSGFPVNASIVSGNTVKDILLEADDLFPGIMPGIRTVPSNTNSLSDYLNFLHTLISGAATVAGAVQPLSAAATALVLGAKAEYVYGGVALHSIDNDYLGFNRAVTISALEQQTQNVLNNCASRLDVPTPTGGTAGVALPPIKVRVLAPGDELAVKFGRPVTASLAVNPAGATVSGTLTVTPVDGIATFDNLVVDRSWTDLRLNFASGSITAQSPSFSVLGGKLEAVAGVNQIGTVNQQLTNPIVVWLRDQVTLQPLSGRAVTFSAAVGSGTLSSGSANTDGNGRASVTWTLGTVAGTQNVSASVDGAQGSPVVFTATARAAAASRLLLSTGNNQSAPAGTDLPLALQAQVVDPFNNGVANVSVSWAVVSGGGSLQPAGISQQTVLTDASGLSSVRLRLGGGVGNGNNVVTASATGLTGTPVTFVASGSNSTTPAKLGFLNQPSSALVGDPITPGVQVAIQSSTGSTISSANNVVSIALGANSNGAVLAGTVTKSATAGVATFGDLTVDRAGTYTLLATSPGLTSATSSTFVVAAPPVASVTLSPNSAGVTVGGTFALTAVLRDANGNVLSGRIVTWTSASPSVASVSSAGVVTGVSASPTPVTITATSEGKAANALITVTASNVRGMWKLASIGGQSLPYRLTYAQCPATSHHVLVGTLDIGATTAFNMVKSLIFSNAAGTQGETVYGTSQNETLGSDAGGQLLIGIDTTGNTTRKRIRMVGNQLEVTVPDDNCAYTSSNPANVVNRTYLYDRVVDELPASLLPAIGRTCDIVSARVLNAAGAPQYDMYVGGLRGTVVFLREFSLGGALSFLRMDATVTALPNTAPSGYWYRPSTGSSVTYAYVHADGSLVHDGTSPPLPVEIARIQVSGGIVSFTDVVATSIFDFGNPPGRIAMDCRLR